MRQMVSVSSSNSPCPADMSGREEGWSVNSGIQVQRQGRTGYFLAWLLVGAAEVAGVLSILSIGPVLLLLGGACGALLVMRRRTGPELSGVLAGLGLPLLYVAFLNRSGPGLICTTSAGGSHCTEQWSPWGWAVIGVLLLASGVLLFLRRSRSDA